ncbi:YaaA family protein [Desulfobacula sp.]|uniref:YaaA family protein n=1 Tax=Desulfobacula sp. TaxID=2593537 RepID=UPI00261EE4B4|nr:YaaA family protein [Desulfobacula sp.]
MLLLLNTTKTMNLSAPVPHRLEVTEPLLMDQACRLADKLAKMSRAQLMHLMSLSEKLADETRANAVRWGREGRPKIPALFGFTGLVYKSLDAPNLDATQCGDAQKRIRILSGLYGLLRPFDQIEAYRLEMGHKLVMGKAKNCTVFWKDRLTATLNAGLTVGEPIISLAAQEYMKALDLKKLNGPVISPVFKERATDGTLKTVAVHAKKARGELVRYALVHKARTPRDLLEFNALGWTPATDVPEKGPWLFTRPVTA